MLNQHRVSSRYPLISNNPHGAPQLNRSNMTQKLQGQWNSGSSTGWNSEQLLSFMDLNVVQLFNSSIRLSSSWYIMQDSTQFACPTRDASWLSPEFSKKKVHNSSNYSVHTNRNHSGIIITGWINILHRTTMDNFNPLAYTIILQQLQLLSTLNILLIHNPLRYFDNSSDHSSIVS